MGFYKEKKGHLYLIKYVSQPSSTDMLLMVKMFVEKMVWNATANKIISMEIIWDILYVNPNSDPTYPSDIVCMVSPNLKNGPIATSINVISGGSSVPVAPKSLDTYTIAGLSAGIAICSLLSICSIILVICRNKNAYSELK